MNTNPEGPTLGALLCEAAGSWYLSIVRKGLFEALLKKIIKKSHTALKVNSLLPNIFLPVQQMIR